MEVELDAEELAFQEQVRTLLREELTPEIRAATAKTTTVFADKDVALAWQRILHKRGWAGVSWPKEFGGPGWTSNQRYIFNRECALAGAPGLIPLGLRMLAPVIFRYGTKEQQDYYLPKILSGEHYWCQGYSEPGSGSDLASLKTKAEKDGDDYIVNGTKIWTTHAQFADHIFCLVRTDAEAKPQAGISFLLIDMDSPGVTVEPITTLAGDHEVNQVFLDNIRAPVTNRVGPENEGWVVAKYLLEFERGGGTAATGLRIAMDNLKILLVDLPADSDIHERSAKTEVEVTALSQMEAELQSKIAKDENIGPGSSLMKNIASMLGQQIAALRLEAMAYYGIPHNNLLWLNSKEGVGMESSQTAIGSYLNTRASSIYGGSREVQKNIIAKTVLGL
ncbi:MAG: acyl-CoA dehydrogenase family protein [Pseudomonadales bacterium]|nr:acyl-CoA dehydrogenase family protein [Pseudomonadales bacterium]